MNDETITDVVQDSNGNYYCIGSRGNIVSSELDYSVGMVWKLDWQGNVIDSSFIITPDKATKLTSLDLIDNNNLIISGYIYDTLYPFYKNSIVLYKLDLQLEIIDNNLFHIEDTLKVMYCRQELTYDNEILLTGYVVGPNYQGAHGFVGRFFEEMESLQFKILDDGIWLSVGIHKLTDSTYFLAGASTNLIYTVFSYMYLDSIFQLTDETGIPESLNPYGFKWDTDTSFYLTTNLATGTTNIHDIGMLYQKDIYDIDDYVFNSWGLIDTFDIAVNHGLDYLNKDSIFFSGTTNFAFGQDEFANVPSWYSIVQTDSLLNVRWERFYGGDAYYIQRVTIATNDGGCLLAGERYDYQNTTELERDIYILKLNSEGLLTNTSEKPQVQMHEALVFPNPGTDYLKVRVAAQYPQSIFELYNINGNKILSEKITGRWGRVETTFLPTGTYVYKIYNQKGLFETGKWVKQ